MRHTSQPRVFFFLAFLAVAVFAGCGGGGGGGGSTIPGGGGGGVPTPTPTVPAAVVTIAPVQPNALPTTTGALPPAITSSQFSTGVAYGQYVYSAAGKINFGTTNPPSTITDSDTSGITCLVYEPAGAASATPCPLAHATSSVTLTSSNDGYAILYNGQPVPGASVNITVSSPSTSYSLPILGAVSLGNIAFGGNVGPVGTLLYDAANTTIYAAIGNPSAPLTATTYNAATGYSAPTAITVSNVNGAAKTSLSATGTGQVLGGAHDITLDQNGNIWIAENNGPKTTQYVAVYALANPAANPTGGTAISVGNFAEYTLLENDSNPKPLKGIASDGTYIWVIDNLGEFWRIDPTGATAGTVHPNQATSYRTITPAQATNAGHDLTKSDGSAAFTSAGVNMGQIGNLLWLSTTSSLYVGEDGMGHIVQITRDISANGTGAAGGSGSCVAAATPCLGYYNASATQQNCPSGVEAIGGSLYSPDCITNKLYKYSAATPPVQTEVSQAAFPAFVFGGVGQAADGSFWTVTPTGLESILSMTSTSTGYVTPSNAACNSLTPSFRANGFITGPDGTLLFSPANPFGNGMTAPVCGLVY